MYETFIDLIYALYYPLLAAIGVPVNLMAILTLSQGKCGLSKCITLYLVAMAAADLMVVVTEVILNRILYYYLPSSSLYITPVCSCVIVLLCVARDTSVWLTVAFTLDRLIAICYRKLKDRYCVPKTASLVIAAVCILFSLKNIPWYFTFDPVYITDNVPWLCQSKPAFYISPGWIGYDWLHRILTPILPFIFILLFNALTVRHIVVANRVRRSLFSNHGGAQVDPETESRRKSMILLFAISGSFIVLWMPYVINFLYYRITNTHYYTGGTDPGYILQQMAYMFQLSSSCTNTCIYVVTQSKFRDQLKTLARTPFARVAQLLK
ncbi:probable G-protein coupled receptor 139 [Scyliorhinus canicula]|uniref:probable G-protein coupled receptor 139 n=1 Tax=Scyliorhinus canicula TaxID=7830 RepID=UPI0018F45A54|nr:probable G-protein coupled receptor 139 [Scyliorhinus canicula]